MRKASDPLQHRLFDLAQGAILAGQKAEKDFAGPAFPLIHRFLDLAQGVIWTGQEGENELAGTGDLSFIDLVKLAFVPARR